VSVWDAGPIVVGHRGGRGVGWPPENTLAAFDRARSQGARAVELDARTCAGGDVVVVHDATLSVRDGRRVADVDAAELRAFGVPLLEEVLSWARACGVAVNVEMKHDVDDGAQLVRGTLGAVRATRADVLLSSFDPRLLAQAAARAPALPRALLVRARQPLWAHVIERLARPPLVAWLHLERPQASPRAVEGALRRGLRLGVWTVNRPEDAVDLVRLGAQSIITDVPGAVLDALALTRS